MKDVTMKKNSFVKGAFITTLGIILARIMGVIYVIPFHAMIGEKGGALYGYAYTIYNVFLSLATAGIPLSISKIVSEYQTLGYYHAKRRAFFLAKRISLLLGFVCFLIILVTAPLLAKAALGNVTGGNTIEDITFVIRMIGTAILIIPTLSVYRGYFQGHRFMSPPSLSEVIEQFVRVCVILLGTYLALKTFGVSLTGAVGVALLGATIGAIFAFLYLFLKKLKNKKKFNEEIRTVNEPFISNEMIMKKIILYAVPFIMIDIFKSLYNTVDMVTVVKGLVHYAKFSATDAEVVYSMLSTWASKFNILILAISSGIIVNIIPNLTESIVKKDQKRMQETIQQGLRILFFFTIPLTFGISFLGKPIWNLFYGESVYGPSVLSFYVFVGLFAGVFTLLVMTLQTLKDYKTVFISLGVGVFIKALLNNSMIQVFYQNGLPAYYGAITASILGYLVSFIICMVVLIVKYHLSFEEVLKDFIEILCGSILMVLGLTLLKFVIPISADVQFINLFIVFAYAAVGMAIYFAYQKYSGLNRKIFGKDFFQSVKKTILSK